MTISSHFRVIWRRKWVVLAASVIIALAVLGISSTRPNVYKSDAQLSVSVGQAQGNQPADQATILFFAQTYAQLGRTQPVLATAATSSGLHISEKTAEQRTSVQASPTVGFVTVSATGSSPADATRLASALSNALIGAVTAQQQQALQSQIGPVQQQINAVRNELNSLPTGSTAAAAAQAQLQALVQTLTQAQLQPTTRLTVIAPAVAESSPVSPKPKTWALLALVTALVVDAELAVAYEVVSDRFPLEDIDEEVGRVTDLPVLARVPSEDPEETVEAFRTLRTNLLFMSTDEQIRTVAIVSSDPAAGKTFVAVNLATSVAELGLSVSLIDADMRRPAVNQRLGLPQTPGLGDVLRGHEVKDVVHHSLSSPSLTVLTAGSPVSDPAGQLGGQLDRRVFAELKSEEIVVVDTPPESLFPDASATALHCDAALLVIDARRARRRAVRATMKRLDQVNATLIGVVINRVPATSKSAAYRYDYNR